MSRFCLDFEPIGRRGACSEGDSILDAARELGIGISSVCDGRGACHSCRVQIIKGSASPVTSKETRFFPQEELDRGWRFACQARPLDNCNVYVPPESMILSPFTQVEGIAVPAKPEPAVIAYDVVLALPSLSDLTADGDRLIAALNQKHQLNCTTIDLAVLRGISPLIRALNGECRAFVRGKEIIHVSPAATPLLGLAVDLGTTKVAGYLLDLASGETLARKAVMNPQIRYGEDIVTRMARAVSSPEEAEMLQRIAMNGLNELADDLCVSAGVKAGDIVDAVIVGNTAMHHLLLGLPVKQLAAAPYVAAIREGMDCKARDMGLHVAPGAYVHIPANIAGFVGADHTADLLTIDAMKTKDTVILVDIGTNTEISLIHKGEIFSVSCASGPAFEGGHILCGMRAAAGAIERLRIENGTIEYETINDASPCGICGSGILDGLAEMYRAGLLDKGGMMADTLKRRSDNGQREFVIVDEGRAISITQGDIRELQLAKAAIRCGIQALLEARNLTDDDIARVIIAGAFGTYIGVESAVTAGMLPPLERGRFTQIGNAAGMGAILALISLQKRKEAKEIARKAHFIELATASNFMQTFTQACFLGRYHLINGKREETSTGKILRKELR